MMAGSKRGSMVATATFPILLIAAGSAQADFKVPADEAEKLKACEMAVCQQIVKKGPAEGHLTCDLSKTWARSFIEDGIKEKSFKWGLGDARCALKLDLGRDILVKALTEPDYTLQIPAQTAACAAETGDSITSVKITLAPKLVFKAGAVTSVTLAVGEIEAPALVKGVIWSAAKMEDTVGLFHSQLLKEINGFIQKRCPGEVPK